MHPSLVNSPFSTMHNHPSRPSTFDPFPGLAATSITAAKPSSIIRLLEALKAAATMHQARPHVLSGWCKWSLARDPGIIAAVQDVAGAGCSVLRGSASVMHNQLVFWCLYAELWTHPPRRWSAWRSPYHCPHPPSLMACNFLSICQAGRGRTSKSRTASSRTSMHGSFPPAPNVRIAAPITSDSGKNLLVAASSPPLLPSPSRRPWWKLHWMKTTPRWLTSFGGIWRLGLLCHWVWAWDGAQAHVYCWRASCFVHPFKIGPLDCFQLT